MKHSFAVSVSLEMLLGLIHKVKWRHISVVAIRSPFCGGTSSYRA